MGPKKKHINPFYVLLVIVGVVFSITACAYGVMTVRALHPPLSGAVDRDHPMLTFLDNHGFTLLMTELAVLGIATVAAMGTDEYWSRRSSACKDGRQIKRERTEK